MRYSLEGTPYRELTAQLIFGLLAHSGIWKPSSGIEDAINRVDKIIEDADRMYVAHPKQMIDLLCISDLATWVASKEPLSDPAAEVIPSFRSSLDPKGTPATSYMRHYFDSAAPLYKPLGVFVTQLLVKLAWQDTALRDIASYFVNLEFSTSDCGTVRFWPKSIYSPSLRKKLKLSSLRNDVGWGEWDCSIE